jgi:hypothetical protein
LAAEGGRLFRDLSAVDTDRRMSELERFIEFWYGPRRPEFGESDAEIRHPELPGALRRFYAFAGRWPSPASGREGAFFYTGECSHHLLPLDRSGPTDDGRLRFFAEYQGDWDGVTTPGEPDPPVWIRGRWDDPEEGEGTRLVSGALSKFLVTHCLMTTVYEAGNSPRPRTCSHVVNNALADWFRRDKASAERLWEAEAGGCPNYDGSFYLLHEHVLVHDTGKGVLKFGALHPEGLELLRGVIGDAA